MLQRRCCRWKSNNRSNRWKGSINNSKENWNIKSFCGPHSVMVTLLTLKQEVRVSNSGAAPPKSLEPIPLPTTPPPGAMWEWCRQNAEPPEWRKKKSSCSAPLEAVAALSNSTWTTAKAGQITMNTFRFQNVYQLSKQDECGVKGVASENRKSRKWLEFWDDSKDNNRQNNAPNIVCKWGRSEKV